MWNKTNPIFKELNRRVCRGLKDIALAVDENNRRTTIGLDTFQG